MSKQLTSPSPTVNGHIAADKAKKRKLAEGNVGSDKKRRKTSETEWDHAQLKDGTGNAKSTRKKSSPADEPRTRHSVSPTINGILNGIGAFSEPIKRKRKKSRADGLDVQDQLHLQDAVADILITEPVHNEIAGQTEPQLLEPAVVPPTKKKRKKSERDALTADQSRLEEIKSDTQENPDAGNVRTLAPTPVEDAGLSEPRSVKKKKKKHKPLESESSNSPADIDVTQFDETFEDAAPGAVPSSYQPEPVATSEEDDLESLPDSESPFHSVRLSLYLALHAISLSSATQSLLSAYLAPLLLTYFPPVQGVVLAFSDPSISAKPPKRPGQPLQPPSDPPQSSQTTTLALAGDEHGVSWLWLTATFLVFRPARGSMLQGYVNICSEGFIGLVLYNYFQTGIARNRIPGSWLWSASGDDPSAQRKHKRGKKQKINDHADHQSESQSTQNADTMDLDFDPDDAHDTELQDTPYVDDSQGHFLDSQGRPVTSRVRFRVVDTEVVPTHGGGVGGGDNRGKWSLQVEGTLLDAEEEEKVRNEEKAAYERLENRKRRRAAPIRADVLDGAADDVMMSGGLGFKP